MVLSKFNKTDTRLKRSVNLIIRKYITKNKIQLSTVIKIRPTVSTEGITNLSLKNR